MGLRLQMQIRYLKVQTNYRGINMHFKMNLCHNSCVLRGVPDKMANEWFVKYDYKITFDYDDMVWRITKGTVTEESWKELMLQFKRD